MNWTEIADGWNRAHIVTSTAPSFAPEYVFSVIRDACVPFARGMRHFALPALTFEADGHPMTAPGGLLPSNDDGSMSEYRTRMSGHARTWRLCLTEPLFTDYRLWSQVRDLLMPLWRTEVGLPVLAVASELIAAQGPVRVCDAETTHIGLIVTLSGSMTLHNGDTTRRVEAGDVVHLADSGPATLHTDDSCLVLRLRVPTGRRLPATEALKVLTDVIAADAMEAAEPVPQPLFPPPVRGRELLLETSEAKERPPHRDDFVARARQLAHLWWAGRASAAGLDPAPEPGEPHPLASEDLVRLDAPILVASGLEPDTDLWSVNGMVFTVRGPTPDRILQLLRTNEIVSVDWLCRDEDGHDNGAEPLVNRLHALRAVKLVEEARA
ncbi:hypothetical protein FB566_1752 [Stackebrandtia endophytica]|uniref:Uncharacterized protein n=1 Tax=Stackebrandtia endophytica TaxID=1496996 RepID=A0A543AUI0_9ACTN|nr:hypothetical protein [Stackebrandtia endophytica]TQL76230.1 hypothetical protein FB566_1752 [Stackebrandtia endophytica]